MELNTEQLAVVNTAASHVIVKSGAGAGKTATLVARIKHLLESGVLPSDIVAITFTNLAAEEMRSRLPNVTGLKICTIHSYANQLLNSIGVDTQDLIEDENFDELFNRIKAYPKCLQLVRYMLIDEGHDLSDQQFDFILDYVEPRNWMFFYDLKQCIYEWRGADPWRLIKLEGSPSTKVFELSRNYRNGKDILSFAKRILSSLTSEYKDTSTAIRGYRGQVIEGEGDICALIDIIQKDGVWKDWFVLTRTNAQAESIMREFGRRGIPYATFKQGGVDLATLKDILNNDQVLVLTSHSSKGLERLKVAVVGARFYSDEERRLDYVSATRAKDMLIWWNLLESKKLKYKRDYTAVNTLSFGNFYNDFGDEDGMYNSTF